MKQFFHYIRSFFKKKKKEYPRLKSIWELSKEDRELWLEEEKQKRQDYYNDLL